MTVTEADWPNVRFVGVHVEVSPRWSGLREVEPLFSRRPYEDWCRLFRLACEADESIDWKGAGFVRSDPENVERVSERFRAITASTNDQFRSFLARALLSQPEDTETLMAIEMSCGASEDGSGHVCGFSSRV